MGQRRQELIVALWVHGLQISRIALAFDLTRDRVRQIIEKETGKVPRVVSQNREKQRAFQASFERIAPLTMTRTDGNDG